MDAAGHLHRPRPRSRVREARWLDPAAAGALIAGAAAATALLRTAPAWAGVLPVVLVTAALLIACLPFLATRPQSAARAG